MKGNLLSDVPRAQSALHETYLAQKCSMETRGGWQVPTHFGSPEAESTLATDGVGIGELCGIGVLDIVGNDIAQLAKKVGAGDAAIGSATTANLNGVKDARWCQLTRHHARVVVGPDGTSAALDALKGEGNCAHVTDISSGLSTFALVGPASPDVLARLTRIDLDPRVHSDRQLVMTGSVGIPLQILRWDRNAVLVYELTVGRDLAEYFWDSVFHAAEDLGLKPLGMSSLAQLGVVSGGAHQ